MEAHLSLALEIVTAQAKVRIMDEAEIKSLAASLSAVICGMKQTPDSARRSRPPQGVFRLFTRVRAPAAGASQTAPGFFAPAGP